MAHLIDKDSLMDEIKRRINEEMHYLTDLDYSQGRVDSLRSVLSFINTLEVKEVDFEKELDKIWFDNRLGDYFDKDAMKFVRIRTLCKHFFELELKA